MSEEGTAENRPTSASTSSEPPSSTTPFSLSGEQQHAPFTMLPPGGAPHFFANPFMNPYMAPQEANWQQNVLPADANAATVPGFMLSPAQYQEMIQQYFQQMMAASGAQFTMPFPMQFNSSPAFQQQRPASQCSQKSEALSDGRVTSASVSSASQEPTQEQRPLSNGTRTSEVTTPSISAQEQTVTDVNREEAPEEQTATTANSTNEVADVLTTTEAEDEVEGQEKAASTSSGASSEEKRKNSGSGSDRTDSLIRKQMNEIEKEINRRSQNKNIKKIDDRELAELIGSAQPSFVATALDRNFAPNFPPMPSTSSSPSSQDQPKSALPYTSPANDGKAPVVKESLNQLRSSFNLAEDRSAPPTPPHVAGVQSQPQHQQPVQMFPTTSPFVAQNPFSMGMAMPGQIPFGAAPPYAMMQQQQPFGIMPGTITSTSQFMQNGGNPSYAPSMHFPAQINPGFVQNGSQNFTPEQLAAVFAQQQLASQQYPAGFLPQPEAPSAAHSPNNSCSIAPPPPPSHPVARRASSSSNPWPEENKENGVLNGTSNGTGDEPVWVLRDSYLKRMQRDQRAQADEMSWHEAATAAQEQADAGGDEDEREETDRLLMGSAGTSQGNRLGKDADRRSSFSGEKKKNSKETMVHEPAVLIEGVLFRARYLGSTQMLCESRGSKAARMSQAQEAVARVKAPEGEIQPSTEIDLFISTEKIMVLNTDLQRISDTDVRQDILMDHALRTISYIADIGDLVVLMARRMSTSNSDESCNQGEGVRKAPKVICHVFESEEASFIAQSIGQAFQVAYVEFLRANGIDDPSYLRQIDYQEVLNSQELLGDELEMFAKKETQKEVVVPKKTGEPLGIVVVESGWGSMLPTVVLAHMNPVGPAAHSNKLNIGDQIININGISLVGLPLSAAQTQIKNMKTATAVRLTVVSTPPVVEVRIRRPDTKYQLGFSVQNGVICSLLRGGIAERGGIRVGHRIIEINGTSVVAVAHDRIVNMLATAIGEIHMKTMPTSMFRLLTGQEQPQYI
ncbi:unnamed protein product [Caenorhabditis auriculariae]|uniref:Protein lin-10 n=1 Tax=Caenorhabditis auriculariae TaxID=2777116 RepID=A0A8S1H657_9PELO|nr:unnamed protein product [Caenorhabditis auriculariae]